MYCFIWQEEYTGHPYYKATPSAKTIWPYAAGGLWLEINLDRNTVKCHCKVAL